MSEEKQDGGLEPQEDKQTIDEFTTEVRKGQIKRMKSLSIDQMFYDKWLEANDEDKVRDELELENKKVETNKEGKIIKDDRDFKAITLLQAKIDKVGKMKQNKLQVEESITDIKFYIDMVDELSNEDKEIFTTIENI